MPAGINLAPGTQFALQARKRRQRLFVASALVIVIAILVWGGLYIFIGRLEAQQDTLVNQLRNVEMEISNLEKEAERIVLFEKRLSSLDSLLNTHLSWNQLFADIERLMPAETVLLNMALNKDAGTADVRGVTTNIDQVAVTLASLLKTDTHQTVFTGARLGSVQRQESAASDTEPGQVSYQFDANFTFDPAILKGSN